MFEFATLMTVSQYACFLLGACLSLPPIITFYRESRRYDAELDRRIMSYEE